MVVAIKSISRTTGRRMVVAWKVARAALNSKRNGAQDSQCPQALQKV